MLVGAGPAIVLPGGLNPFLPGKVAVVGLGLLVAVWAVRPRCPQLPRWALVSGVVLLVWLAAATAAGTAPRTSLLGAPTRLLGLVAWGGFVAAVGLGAGTAARLGIERALVLTARWSALPVVTGAVLGGSELLDRPVVPSALEFESRVLGSFGSPSLTAALLALLLPLVAGAALVDRPWRAAHVITAVLGASTLVVTQSRAALVAVTLAAVALVVHKSVRGRDVAHRTRSALLGTGVVVVLVAGALLGSGRAGQLNTGLEGRIDTWSVAVGVIADRPLGGTGPEGFAAAFASQVDEEFVERHTREQVTDRAHNLTLDVTVIGGVPAGLAHALLMAGVVVACWRRRRGPVVATAATVGCAAYVLQQQVLFAQPVHDTLLWFIIGVVLAPLDRLPATGQWSSLGRLGVGGLAVVAAMAGGAAVRADQLAADAYRIDGAEAVRAAEQAVAAFPSGDLYGLVLTDRALATQEPDLLRRVAARLADLEDRSFATGSLRLARIDLLQRLHQRTRGGAPGTLAEAEQLLTELLERDPTNGQAWLKLGVVAHEQGERDRAVAAWHRAHRLLPGRPEPGQNLQAVGAAADG